MMRKALFISESLFAEKADKTLRLHTNHAVFSHTSLNGNVGHDNCALLRDKLPVRSSSKKRRFLEYFNVVSTERAEVLRRTDSAEQVVCDVIVLDDSEDDELQPLPKSLPSDGATFQRHSVKKKNVVVIKKGSDTAASSNSATKLLQIDVCSFLGQRLRDHVGTLNTGKYEPYEKGIAQPLSYSSALVNNVSCRLLSTSVLPASPFIDKLRQNSEYRITFRPCRRSVYTHAYKFTRRQRKEFCRAFDCGLSIRSRRLLKRMKPCRMKVLKLSPIMLQTYCSKISMPDYEVTSNQNSLVVQNRKSFVSLMRCDYQKTSCQTKPSLCESDMSECKTREAAVVRPTVDSSQCHVDREPSETVASSAPLIANESSVELKQQSTRVTSNFPSCLSSDAGLNPTTTSSNFVEIVTQTTDNNFQTTDCARSMKEVHENKMNSSCWSMNVDLPALSFLCNICSNVIDCVHDSKLLIFDHYAGHGITNIDIREEIAPSGEKVIQLIELPVVNGNTSKTVTSQASCLSTAASTSNSILRHAYSFLQAEDVELGIDSAAAVMHPQKKGKRVTWSDEVSNTATQQQHRISSLSCLNATHPDAMTGFSKRGLTSSTRQQTVIMNNGSVSSAFCCNNNVTTNTSVAPSTQMSGVGTRPPSSTVDGSTSCSFAIRHSDILKTASERARMFWSNSDLGRTTTAGGPSSRGEQPCTFHSPKPISTALPFQSKQTTNSMLLSGGAWDEYSDAVCRSVKSPSLIAYISPSGRHPGLADGNIMSSRINSHMPQMTLNNCRQRDFIFID